MVKMGSCGHVTGNLANYAGNLISMKLSTIDLPSAMFRYKIPISLNWVLTESKQLSHQDLASSLLL